MNTKTMNDREKIESEKKELNLLINKGVNITIEHNIRVVTRKGFMRMFRKYETKTEKLTFTIKEPTLSVLDRLSAEQIDIVMDEKKIIDEGMQEAKILASQNARRMARIMAISVLGSDYDIITKEDGLTRHKHDDKKLDELTELFFQNVKPSELLQYVILINTMSNLGDFMNSIRLTSAARTTMPILVEENKEA